LDIKNIPGAGAAGGLGYAVMLFLKGKLEKGIDIVTRVSALEEKMQDADLVITGEGKIDFQTAFGKTPMGVCQIAKKMNIPVIVLAGSLGKDYKTLYTKGFDGIFSIMDKPMKLEDAIDNTKELLENTTEAIIRFWISFK
jgi:glycerate kinase